MSKWVEFEEVRCKAQSDNALLVVIDEEEYWIPKSQLSEDSEVQEKGDEGTLIVTEWIAKEKDLI